VSQVALGRDDVLWVATVGGGLNRLDRRRGSVVAYRHNPGVPWSLSRDDVSSVLVDRRTGAVWAGTFGGGLNRLDPATGRFTHYRHDATDPFSLSSDEIYALYQTDDDALWISTVARGLNRFDTRTGRFIRYQHQPNDTTSLSYDSVWPMLENSTLDALWIGTIGGGLNRFDPATGTFAVHRPDVLGSARVVSLYLDPQDILWIGTMGEGLSRLNPRRDTFARYTKQDGLAGNDAACMLEGEPGTLWIGTEAGLSRFEVQSERFRNFDESHGLPSANTYFGACTKSEAGELFFGTYNGLVSFWPDSLKEPLPAPPVALTGFDVLNKPARLDTSITHRRQITLSHDQNDVAFHFAALDFTVPEKNRYRYQLVGAEDDWIEAGDRHYVSYTNLSPGTYRLRVKGSNSDGVWTAEEAVVRLTILPPWWGTRWFRVLMGLVLLGISVGTYTFRVLQLKQRTRYLENEVTRRTEEVASQKEQLQAQADQLKALDEMKSRFFANISHEFRTPLALIMGPLTDLINKTGDLPREMLHQQLSRMLRNSRRLLRLVNQLLDLSRLESGAFKVQARRIQLNDFLQDLVHAFRALAEPRGIDLTFVPAPAPCPVFFDPDSLQKVFSNLLSNALKFTPEGGSVSVQVRQHGEGIDVAVADTGEGIPEDQLPHIFDRFYQVDNAPTRRYEGTGIGLALARELLSLHTGKITVESRVGVGSIFTAHLQPGTAHLRPDQLARDEPDPTAPVAFDPELLEEAPQQPPADDAVPEALPDEEIDATTVLVVEDNAEMQAYIRQILQPHFRVLVAADGTAGLARAQEALPDLIVADVMMPRMDGFALARALQEGPMTRSIPLVFVTARAEHADELEGLTTGAVDYVTKPFAPDILLVRVQGLLKLRRRLRDRILTDAGILLPSPADRPESDFARNVRTLVPAHLSDPYFSVDRLRELLGMSSTVLYDRFKNELEATPADYIRKARVECAARLLRKTPHNISEVAYAAGFNSLSHFDKAFKRYLGMTPSDYADRHR